IPILSLQERLQCHSLATALTLRCPQRRPEIGVENGAAGCCHTIAVRHHWRESESRTSSCTRQVQCLCANIRVWLTGASGRTPPEAPMDFIFMLTRHDRTIDD